MNNHEIAAKVNELRDIAINFSASQQLRERIAHAIVDQLKLIEPLRAWKEAVIDEGVCCHIGWDETNPRKSLQDIISWHVAVALDPAVSTDAQALIERGRNEVAPVAAQEQHPDTLSDLQRQIATSHIDHIANKYGKKMPAAYSIEHVGDALKEFLDTIYPPAPAQGEPSVQPTLLNETCESSALLKPAQSERKPAAWRIRGFGYDHVIFHEPRPLVDYRAEHTITPLYE